jgi:thiol:disulfide interchange protein DsbD
MFFKGANPRLILRAAVVVGLAVLLVPTLAWAGPDTQFDASQGLLWMYAVAFGVGFLTSLTPCVYPMIPIVIGVFGARDEKVSRKKAFLLASAYVLGMGVMYSALGVIFALLGKQFGTFLADPKFVIPIVFFYVLLAASMFGAFEIALPQSMQNRLNQVGGKGYGGAFGMGLVGGLTAAPCTGPFLAGILGFVAAKGSNVFAGASLLFVYAMGMGVLFWLIAAFAVAVPKSGRWMEWVKSFGGIALLAVGIYFMRPIIPALRKATDPGMAFLFGAIAVAIIGLGLGAIHLSFHDRAAIKARKGLAVVLTLVGITGVVNWSLTPPSVLPWEHDEKLAFAEAKESGRGVMIDFAAEWCLPCKELEAKTFSAFEVRERVADGYVPLKFDVTEDSERDEKLKERYHAENLPAVIFLDAEGKELGRVNKFLPPDEFIATMDKLESPRQASR